MHRWKKTINPLNDVTEIGTPLLNKLCNALIRNKMCPVTLTGDLKQAILHIRSQKGDRDAWRFHWIKGIEKWHWDAEVYQSNIGIGGVTLSS